MGSSAAIKDTARTPSEARGVGFEPFLHGREVMCEKTCRTHEFMK